MLRVAGSEGVRAWPASDGRLSRSGHSFVPSLTNFHPLGFVLSTTGLNTRKARRRPRNPGISNAAEIRTLLRRLKWRLE